MPQATDSSDSNDHYDFARFTSAQEGVYDKALSELRCGQKQTHWMWFIFPQIDGLGCSAIAKHYAIKSAEEARLYLNHTILGARLLECSETVFAVEDRSISAIFGFPDDLKLKSSMTLFSHVTDPDSVFDQVLDKYFNGKRDTKTLELLENHHRK